MDETVIRTALTKIISELEAIHRLLENQSGSDEK
jgi:hypothetical protein